MPTFKLVYFVPKLFNFYLNIFTSCLAVVLGMWYQMENANPFLADGSWPSGRDAQHSGGWRCSLWDAGVLGSLMELSIRSNSIIICLNFHYLWFWWYPYPWCPIHAYNNPDIGLDPYEWVYFHSFHRTREYHISHKHGRVRKWLIVNFTRNSQSMNNWI